MLMARTPQDITDAERAVLEVLWDKGPATIRHIADILYPNGRAAQYATVQKLLERLEGKECVRCDRRGAVNVFAPNIGREELLGRRLQALAEELCGGSMTSLLTHLVQNHKLSTRERAELRGLIDRLDAASRKERP
jgi:BlaI family penicillinase repressor